MGQRQEHVRRKTVFLHIMKTGGITFRNILMSLHPDSFHLSRDPSLEAIVSDIAGHDCVELHIRNTPAGWVHLHAELAAQGRWDLLRDNDFFMMVREPVDQVLSNFHAMQRHRERIEPRMRAIGVTFPETLEAYIEQPRNFNGQTAFIIAKDLQGESLVGEDDLARAKAVILETGAHVGLTDRFDDSVRILGKVKGLQVPAFEIHNAAPARARVDEIPEHLRETIRRKSVFDAQLYEFARERFERELEELR